MVEGWGIKPKEWFSDMLERMTGIEHLNFGVSHFGTYQSFLAYKHFGKQFDHTAVMIGMFAANDFLDNNLELSKRASEYKYFYRPYLTRNSGQWSHVELMENPIKRFIRRYSFTASAINELRKSFSRTKTETASKLASTDTPTKYRSSYYNYYESDFDRIVEILKLLRLEAENRKIVLLMIPNECDLKDFAENGESFFYKRLLPHANSLNVELISLLPVLHAEGKPLSNFFHSCDFHWNALANKAASKYLFTRLYEDTLTVQQ